MGNEAFYGDGRNIIQRNTVLCIVLLQKQKKNKYLNI